MGERIGIREARERAGLRLVLLPGFPSPWSQAARALFELKRVPFVAVAPDPGDGPDALLEWTRQESYPVAVYEDERPRAGWAEILLLAERLGPEPAMIPADPEERALGFGLAHEILGEMGLVWCRRLVGLAPAQAERPDDPTVAAFTRRYGSSPAETRTAARRVEEVLDLLARQLRRQQEAGREFLVGEALSAVDLYWAVSANLFAPRPPDELRIPEATRQAIVEQAEPFRDALDPILLEHQRRIHQDFLHLPLAP